MVLLTTLALGGMLAPAPTLPLHGARLPTADNATAVPLAAFALGCAPDGARSFALVEVTPAAYWVDGEPVATVPDAAKSVAPAVSSVAEALRGLRERASTCDPGAATARRVLLMVDERVAFATARVAMAAAQSAGFDDLHLAVHDDDPTSSPPFGGRSRIADVLGGNDGGFVVAEHEDEGTRTANVLATVERLQASGAGPRAAPAFREVDAAGLEEALDGFSAALLTPSNDRPFGEQLRMIDVLQGRPNAVQTHILWERLEPGPAIEPDAPSHLPVSGSVSVLRTRSWGSYRDLAADPDAALRALDR